MDQQRVAYIDLDAHQGNGVYHAFLDDDRVFIFDMYNAGTDVYAEDPLGGLGLSAEGVLQRDLFVVEQL